MPSSFSCPPGRCKGLRRKNMRRLGRCDAVATVAIPVRHPIPRFVGIYGGTRMGVQPNLSTGRRPLGEFGIVQAAARFVSSRRHSRRKPSERRARKFAVSPMLPTQLRRWSSPSPRVPQSGGTQFATEGIGSAANDRGLRPRLFPKADWLSADCAGRNASDERRRALYPVCIGALNGRIGNIMSEQSAVLTPPRQESRNGAHVKTHG